MEYQFPNLFTFVLSFFLIIIWRFIFKKTSRTSSNLPPGPWKLPLIGNIHQLVGSLPPKRLTDLAKKYGPLMHLQLGETSNIVISSAEVVKEVIKNHDINISQRPKLVTLSYITYNFTDITFAPYGGYWRHLRKLCTSEVLSPKRVQSFRSIREEEVSNLITHISSDLNHSGLPVINLSKLLYKLTNDITARASFGEKCKDREAFIRILIKLFETIGNVGLADIFPSVTLFKLLSRRTSELERAHQEMDRIFENIISDHRQRAESKTIMENACEHEAADDILNILLKLQHSDLEFPLTSDNVKAIIFDLFGAGTETSTMSIVWAMSELVKNPKIMKKAQAEVRQVFDVKGNVDETDLGKLEYLKSVVKETMRLHPPIPLIFPRECAEMCMINGYEIPAGTKVIFNAWAIGRDPSHWIEPESFNPERFLGSSVDYNGGDFELIPFGAGRRMCPGITFGIANIELSLAQLLYHFNWKLPDEIKNQDLDMTEVFRLSLGRKNDLYLIPTPYHRVPNDP